MIAEMMANPYVFEILFSHVTCILLYAILLILTAVAAIFLLLLLTIRLAFSDCWFSISFFLCFVSFGSRCLCM